jgi:hypothetical protein
VTTAIGGAGNAIAVFGSSCCRDLAGGSWPAAAGRRAAPLPSGSSGGLVVADPAGTFAYASTTGDAFTFSRRRHEPRRGQRITSSLAGLKIVAGQAAMLAADAVSAEPVS